MLKNFEEEIISMFGASETSQQQCKENKRKKLNDFRIITFIHINVRWIRLQFIIELLFVDSQIFAFSTLMMTKADIFANSSKVSRTMWGIFSSLQWNKNESRVVLKWKWKFANLIRFSLCFIAICWLLSWQITTYESEHLWICSYMLYRERFRTHSRTIFHGN